MWLRFPAVAVVLLSLSACASFEFVELPTRDADLYPYAHKKLGIAIAIDEINDPERSKKYFGRDLIEDGILPVHILLSNHGQNRIGIRPSDALLMKGREVIDPLPIEMILERVKDRAGIITDGTEESVDLFFAELRLNETVVAPNDVYSGVLFFKAVEKPSIAQRFFRVFRPFPKPSMRLQLAVTDLETGERLHFGPFGVQR